MSEPAITATRLAKTYGDVVALGGIDLEAQEGTRMTTLSSDPERNPCPVRPVRLPGRSIKCEPFVVLPANVNGEH